MEKLLKSYDKEIYIERKPQLSNFASKLPDAKIIEILSEIEKIEDKKKEIYRCKRKMQCRRIRKSIKS